MALTVTYGVGGDVLEEYICDDGGVLDSLV